MSKAKHIVCPQCVTINAVAPEKPVKEAKCGKCGAQLFDGHPTDIDAVAFKKQINRSDVPVLVDVWAPWCGPRRMMAPAFEEAAQALEPDVRLVKLNSDNEQALSQSLGIRGIPTMLLMYRGKELARTSGAMPAQQIVAWVRAQLSATAA